eukprot:Skav219659  [mRNA]  locus=scaffold1257:33015:33593:+ [translate_table: standard]
MSHHHTSVDDEDVVNLSVEFEGLFITVSGPAENSVRFLRRLGREAASGSSGQDGASGGYRGPSGAQETRDSIEGSFETCPANILALASQLSSSKLSPTERVQRAWKAGKWAEAVRRGRASSPNRTPTIDLQNRCYVVLSSPSHPKPKVYYSSRAFFCAVGDLEKSSAICHGFPTQTEARIYLAAAGEDFPED